ncbi:MAG: SUMF1/EgtB/PvdO family nonheme iron enzyme, partial [Desulfobacterales bacterium]|nr:SUMF1/EgtB/PvdO family nonheme iron enzyme [Desulfobacterales bacterium]
WYDISYYQFEVEQNKDSDPNKCYSYFDLVNAQKIVKGWDTVPIRNVTNGIFIDKLDYTFYEKDTWKNLEDTTNELILFKLRDFERLNITRQPNLLTEDYTLTNPNDCPVIAIVFKDNIDHHQRFTIAAKSSYWITADTLSNIGCVYGENYFIYIVDAVLGEYMKYKGLPSLADTLKNLAQNQNLTLDEFVAKYGAESVSLSQKSPYAFIQVFNPLFMGQTNTAPEILNFSADVREGMPPLTVTFTYKAMDAEDGESLRGSIDFGDGVISPPLSVTNDETITHIYKSEGDYLASFEVVDAGKKTANKDIVIYAVSSDLSAEVIVSPSTLPVKEKVTVTVKIDSGNPPYTVDIDWGLLNPPTHHTITGNAAFTTSYTNAGTYNIVVSITDAAGKTYKQTEQVTVTNYPSSTATASVLTKWTTQAHDVDKEYREYNIPITLTPRDANGTTYYEYATSWVPQPTEDHFWVKYHLPVPYHGIDLSKKVRLTAMLKESSMPHFIRELGLITDTKAIASLFIDRYYNGSGIFRVTQLTDGKVLTNQNVPKLADQVNPKDPNLFYTYAIEIVQGAVIVYRVSNDSYVELFRYSDASIGKYLNEIQVAFLGNGKFIFSALEYDKDGNGTYEDTELMVLNTLDQQVEWSSVVDKTAISGPFTNSLGMTFVKIPAGTFMMGSPSGDRNAYSNEFPQHQVTLTKDYYMQATEVTVGQWCKVMGYEDDYIYFHKTCWNSDEGMKNCPIMNISWNRIQLFISKLNAMDKSRQYRLPTEAEWERACRGGAVNTTNFYFGDCLSTQQANYSTDYYSTQYSNWSYYKICPWYSGSVGGTVFVGTYTPNAYGLYDMHGNVNEWCQDWYNDTYYSISPTIDPKGPEVGTRRVIRGGSYFFGPTNSRSAYRNKDSYSMIDTGFRLVAD